MAKHATVDDYIAAIPEPLREVAETARAVIDAELDGASSAIKWAHPTWSIGKAPVCYLKTASRHVTFGFWRGASIDDRSGRLETSGEVMAHAKLREPADVDRPLFADWLRQTRARAHERRSINDRTRRHASAEASAKSSWRRSKKLCGAPS